ncbi:phage major tail tube protein [Marinimicrobium sp. ARAG 43.8]|uniref:phage major tail tube protein n=1 Tax=Marinimicrobium sp. ARAG 43.8 TaxID=3418719 RepID=UPI003CF8521C
MALPKKLRDFNLFGDGEAWQSQIAELALPKLTRKMEEYRGSGMDGTLEIDMGQEKIEFEWTAAGLIESIFDGYGATAPDHSLLRFSGAYVRDDTGETTSADVIVRGRHREIDMGTAKAGENNEIKVVTTCSYYKLVIDGQTFLEIDVPGNVFIGPDGVDRMAERRRATGL